MDKAAILIDAQVVVDDSHTNCDKLVPSPLTVSISCGLGAWHLVALPSTPEILCVGLISRACDTKVGWHLVPKTYRILRKADQR